ncbi:MAG: GDSL-type esterase/lipase family protein [Planctomycetota bacterium]|jgi:beta-glucosidase
MRHRLTVVPAVLAVVWVAVAAPGAGPAAEADGAHAAVTPAARTGPHHERFLALNERVQAGPVDLVFIGDSITQGWEGAGREVWHRHYGDRNAVNLGISGDRTQHVLWRLEHGNVDGIAPRAAIVMIGTNNSNGNDHPVREIAEGVAAVVAALRERLPETRILLLDIFPRGERPNPQRGKVLQVNQLLRKLDDGDHVRFLAIGHRFVEADGTISRDVMPDFLHLSPAGYEIWAEAIEAPLAELMGEPAAAGAGS